MILVYKLVIVHFKAIVHNFEHSGGNFVYKCPQKTFLVAMLIYTIFQKTLKKAKPSLVDYGVSSEKIMLLAR